MKLSSLSIAKKEIKDRVFKKGILVMLLIVFALGTLVKQFVNNVDTIDKQLDSTASTVREETGADDKVKNLFEQFKKFIFNGNSNLEVLLVSPSLKQGEVYADQNINSEVVKVIIKTSPDDIDTKRYDLILDIRNYPNIGVETNTIVSTLYYYFILSRRVERRLRLDILIDRLGTEDTEKFLDVEDSYINITQNVSKEEAKEVFLNGSKYLIYVFACLCLLRINGISNKVKHSFSESYSRDRVRNILSFYSARRFLLEMTIGVSIAAGIQVFLYSIAFYLARVGFTFDLAIPSEFFSKTNMTAVFVTLVCLAMITVSFCVMGVWSGLQQHEDKSMILNFMAIFKTIVFFGLFLSIPVVLIEDPGIRFLGASFYIPFFDDLRVIALAVSGKPDWGYLTSMVLFHTLFTVFVFTLCLGKFAKLYQSYNGSIVKYLLSYVVRGEKSIIRST